MLDQVKVIITGAASGIGKAIVLACLNEGAKVIACDVNQNGLEELQNISQTTQLDIYQIDVSDFAATETFFNWVESKHSDTNALVNNAGIYLGQNLLHYSEKEIDRVININLKGAIYFSQGFGKLIFSNKRKGNIVNISSISAQEGSSDAIYGASKAAILGLTKSCAMNFAPYIRVNTVAPTLVNTAMMKIVPEWRQAQYLEHHLIPEQLLPEDVAQTVMFLLSDQSRHYTGATFDINSGGYLR